MVLLLKLFLKAAALSVLVMGMGCSQMQAASWLPLAVAGSGERLIDLEQRERSAEDRDRGIYIYCTVAKSGNYAIELRDQQNQVVTTFDRICTQFDERRLDQHNDQLASVEISARTVVNQIQTTAMGSQAYQFDVVLSTEFFLQANPNNSAASVSLGSLWRKCDQVTAYPLQSLTMARNSVLSTAARKAQLRIKYGPGHQCQ